MEPISFILFGLQAAIRLEYIAYVPEPLEGVHTISINKSSPRATPLLSIIVGETIVSPPEFVIRLTEDGRPVELPLSDILRQSPGYPLSQAPSQAQVEAIIMTALVREGVLGRSTSPQAPVATSLPLHATLKVCTACRRWERIDDEDVRMHRCGGCKVAWFCDEQCAEAAWSATRHKVSCRYEEAVRLQIALEGHWDYFLRLKPPFASAQRLVHTLISRGATLTTEVKSLRQDWHRCWPTELAAAPDEINWAYLGSRSITTHRFLEEKLVELFDVDIEKDKALALAQNIRNRQRDLTRVMMGQMEDIYAVNTRMMEMHTAGVVLMRAEGLQYVLSVILAYTC